MRKRSKEKDIFNEYIGERAGEGFEITKPMIIDLKTIIGSIIKNELERNRQAETLPIISEVCETKPTMSKKKIRKFIRKEIKRQINLALDNEEDELDNLASDIAEEKEFDKGLAKFEKYFAKMFTVIQRIVDTNLTDKSKSKPTKDKTSPVEDSSEQVEDEKQVEKPSDDDRKDVW